MSAQEVSTTSNYSSLHHPSDTYFLSTPSVSLSHTQHTLSHTYTHTQPGIHIRTVLSLLSLVTHTLVSGAIKVLSANSLLQKLSHVARGVSLPAETLWAPGTRTTHYFHGKGQELCHLTLKWSWVELPPPRQWPKVSFLFCLSYSECGYEKHGPLPDLPVSSFWSQWLPDMEVQIIGCRELHNEPEGL